MLIRVDWTIAAEGDFDPGQSDRAFNLLVSDYTLAPEILKLSAAGAANRSWARRHVTLIEAAAAARTGGCSVARTKAGVVRRSRTR